VALVCAITQVIAAGRRRHFYIYDLAGGQVERVAGIVGRDERSCEGFAASRAAGGPPLLAFYGNEGHIPLVSLKTRQAVGSLKMNGSVRTAAFSADGNQLLSSGSDGVVYVWDLRTQRCLSRAVDEGCLHASSLATSADGRYVATGADSGVVNLYGYDALLKPSTSKFLPSSPKPLKTLMNLTTTIDTLCFK
jgi:U3 small nucleolar RNA-associated protein 18